MLTSELYRKIRQIEIHTRHLVNASFAGEYQAVFKGRGMEFDEVRPYTPGDDVRGIDWNVTARSGTPYVKRYVEERQLTLMLMADVSASQDFGSGARSKREATAELCALLAFSATRNDDKVGLALFHGDIEQYIPPRKGQKHALRVVREVLAHGAVDAPGDAPAGEPREGALRALARAAWDRFRDPAGRSRRPRAPRQATDVAHALEFLMQVTSRRTICFVVSDFLDEGFETAMVAANRKHDVIAVLVTDPRELALPDVGLVALRDAETGETRLVDTGSSAFRERAAAEAAARVDALEHRFRSLGIDFVHVDAAGDVVDPLVRFFRMRERRTRR